MFKEILIKRISLITAYLLAVISLCEIGDKVTDITGSGIASN